MTALQSTCVQLTRADAALMHAFRHRHHHGLQIDFDMKRLYRAASEVVNTLRFTGPSFAAANDNTMVVGVA